MPRGRPRKPDDQIKHPRTTRKQKSTFTATILDVPEPSAKEKKRWAKLEEECIKAVVTNGPNTDIPIRNKVRIAFKEGYKFPEGWPPGRKVKELCVDGRLVMQYNAEAILIWLYERKLSKWSPSLLYRWRQNGFNKLHKLDKILDELEEVLDITQ